MKNFTQKLESDLTCKINFITLQESSIIEQSAQCMDEVSAAMTKLKNFTLKYRFASEEEEIHFFKNEKPKFLSKLIYYTEIFQMESRKPYAGKDIQINYYNDLLARLHRFTEYNLDFYKYYRGNLTYYDSLYFLRGKLDLKLVASSTASQFDSKFATNHDFTVAKIMANDMLQLFLTEQIEKVKGHAIIPQNSIPGIPWTETKTALIELIYALHFSGSIANGEMEIKEIVQIFEKMFEVELGDVYRTFTDIKLRTNPTKYLDSLKSCLTERLVMQMD